MINYSVFTLPNPINPEKAPLAYAKAQVSEVMSFRKFTQHIADHGGYTRGKVKGILSDMCVCLVEMLLEGKKVQLDELGDFWISLSSEGAETCEDFTSDNIKAVNIVFTPGPDFENLVTKAEFNPVASRIAQAAMLKAEKTGVAVVDLAAAKKKATVVTPSEDESGSGNSGSGSGTGGNTGSGSDSGSTGSDTGDTGSGSGGYELE